MKKTVSMLLSAVILIAMFIVPVNIVGAVADGYADYYEFSFAANNIYSYTSLKKGNEAAGTLSFTNAKGAFTSVVPLYGSTNYVNNWAGMKAEYKSIEIGGTICDSLNFVTNNDAVLVPITSEGKPFELAPGHTYRVNIAYTHTGNGTGDSWYAKRGLYLGGGLYSADLNSNKHARQFASVSAFGSGAVASMPYGAKIDGLLNIDSTGVIERTATFTTPAQTGAGYTYDAEKNAYTATVTYTSASGGAVVGSTAELDFYNYFYLYVDHYGTSEINITKLEIIRDDYAAVGTVEYIDEDGTVLKSEQVAVGEYAINYIPENTDEKYFLGWYSDKECENKISSAKLSVGEDGLKIYAKWDTYKESVVSKNPSYYYGIVNVPSLTASGVYSASTSARSSVNTTTITTASDKLSLSTAFWGDGILLTGADDTTGELFRAKPNTKYKITLKFRITSETTRADGIDVSIAAGAGLPDTNSNYPMGKYWDENNLKNRSSYTQYIDGVTSEGKYLTYAAVYTTGDFTTIPAIGVELWLYQDASVEIYSLSISEFYGESVEAGEFLVSNEVKNNTTYMINFDYALLATPSADIGVGFKTTASDTVGYPSYIEGENIAIYTIDADVLVDQWQTATVLLTTDMMSNVKNSYGYDDILTTLNTNLYGYIIGEDKNLVSVKNVKIKELKNSAGADLINAVGGQCLTADAEEKAGSQALRYSYSYDTVTGNEIIIDGKEYYVKERGFIYVNGNNYAKGGLYKADFNLTNAKAGKFKYNGKNTNLDVCWKYSAIEGTELYNLTFSTYVKDFDLDDTKELMVKAYVIIEIDGQLFTVYSDSVNRSVAYLKSLV